MTLYCCKKSSSLLRGITLKHDGNFELSPTLKYDGNFEFFPFL